MPIYFARPLFHGVDHLHTAYPRGLSLGTYNIYHGRGFSLAQAIWEVHIDSFDVMLLTETNITSEAYCHIWIGYNVMCLQAVTMDTDVAQGGVVMVVREQPKE